MKIAVLAWGSLLWSPRELKVVEGEWNTNGPLLPIEFSRIASDGRLTLVIDKDFDDITVYWKLMTVSDLNFAIENLRLREAADSIHEIGFINCNTRECNIREDIKYLSDRVLKWGKENSIDAIIWTDLSPKFREKTGKEFDLITAKEYLKGLRGETLARAREYIIEAPSQTKTRLRRELEKILDEINEKSH